MIIIPKVTVFLFDPQTHYTRVIYSECPEYKIVDQVFYEFSLKHTFIICFNITPSSQSDFIKHNSIFTSFKSALFYLIYAHFYFILSLAPWQQDCSAAS